MKDTDYPHYPHRASNSGHGHVFPRPDGRRTRCGGYPFCSICLNDAASAAPTWLAATITDDAADDERKAAAVMLSTVNKVLDARRHRELESDIEGMDAQRGGSGARGLFQHIPTTGNGAASREDLR